MSWQELHKNFQNEKLADLILKKINLGSILEIQNKTYTALGKASYNADGHSYHKVFLSDNSVIAFMDDDTSSVFFGTEITELPYSQPFPDVIEYKNKSFQKNWEEHQVIDKILFGNVEGECNFWDYTNGIELISIAILSEIGKRADVYGKDIPIEDIKIIQE